MKTGPGKYTISTRQRVPAVAEMEYITALGAPHYLPLRNIWVNPGLRILKNAEVAGNGNGVAVM